MTDLVALFERGVIALEKLVGQTTQVDKVTLPAGAAGKAAAATAPAKPTQTTKPAPAAATKPAAAARPTAATKEANRQAAAAGAPQQGTRKSPKGTLESTVVAALRKVKDAPHLGNDAVRKILNEAGATNIGSLKPDMFEAVIEACNAEFDGEGEGEPAEDDALAGL